MIYKLASRAYTLLQFSKYKTHYLSFIYYTKQLIMNHVNLRHSRKDIKNTQYIILDTWNLQKLL